MGLKIINSFKINLTYEYVIWEIDLVFNIPFPDNKPIISNFHDFHRREEKKELNTQERKKLSCINKKNGFI